MSALHSYFPSPLAMSYPRGLASTKLQLSTSREVLSKFLSNKNKNYDTNNSLTPTTLRKLKTTFSTFCFTENGWGIGMVPSVWLKIPAENGIVIKVNWIHLVVSLEHIHFSRIKVFTLSLKKFLCIVSPTLCIVPPTSVKVTHSNNKQQP